MSDKTGYQAHLTLAGQTGLRKITKEQQAVMDRLMGDTAEFTLEDETVTDPYCTALNPVLKRTDGV